MDLLKKVDFFYRLATLKLAQVIDKTRVNPSSIDEYGDRIVVSNKPEFDLTPKKVAQSAAFNKNKPHGVWYAFGSSWISLMEIQGSYAYRIKIDDSKILKLNPSNIGAFIEKYTTFIDGEDVARSMGIDVENLPPSKRREIQYIFTDKKAIDWEKVASTYAGVEIRDMRNFPVEIRHSWDFLGAWDIDSGCVFDSSIIKGATKLGELPSFKGEDSYGSELFGGYWDDSSSQLKNVFKDKTGLVLGSSLEDFDQKWLSTKLTQYNVHLTQDQIRDVEFLVGPSSLTLKKVPAAPSHDGKVINL